MIIFHYLADIIERNEKKFDWKAFYDRIISIKNTLETNINSIDVKKKSLSEKKEKFKSIIICPCRSDYLITMWKYVIRNIVINSELVTNHHYLELNIHLKDLCITINKYINSVLDDIINVSMNQENNYIIKILLSVWKKLRPNRKKNIFKQEKESCRCSYVLEEREGNILS